MQEEFVDTPEKNRSFQHNYVSSKSSAVNCLCVWTVIGRSFCGIFNKIFFIGD